MLKFGSNKLRNKQNHAWTENWPKSKVETPITKGRNYAMRGKTIKKRRNILGDFGDQILQKEGTKKQKISHKSMILDDIE